MSTYDDNLSLGRHHFPEPWEKDADNLTGAYLTAHLPNGLFFETSSADEEEGFVYVGCKAIGTTETLHVSTSGIRELGEHLVKMADLIEYREDQAQMAQWTLEDAALTLSGEAAKA